jgi:hypothetical protein
LQGPLAGAPITVWVKRMDVADAQYVEVENLDLEQTVSKFKARWVADEKLDVRPSLVTLRLVKCGAGKPTAKQEAKAKVLDDPSLSLAQVNVTDTAWLLADVTQSACRCCHVLFHALLNADCIFWHRRAAIRRRFSCTCPCLARAGCWCAADSRVHGRSEESI